MSCLSYLKINGVDKKNDILDFTISHGINESTAEITVNTRMGVALTWVSGQTVAIKTTDNFILFYGRISNITRTIAKNATYNWKITCKDVRLDYNKYTVNISFDSTTTVSQALTILINNYTSDSVGTDSTDKTTLCPLSFSGDPFPEAIKACLDMLQIPCVWSISYNDGTGAITHNFTRRFYTNVGELDYVDLDTGDYVVNTDEIFNHVEIFSSSVVWPNPDVQYYDYRQNLEVWEGTGAKPNRVKLPLKRPAKGLMAYLLVGNDTANIKDFMQAGKIPWTNINGVDNADGALIGFDYKTTGQFVVPGYSMTSTGNIVSNIYDGALSIAFTGSVNTRILELLQPDSALYLQSAAKDDAPNGYLYIPTLAWLKDKVDIISKYAGTVIPPENILGWAVQMTVEQPKTVKLDNAASQATYGYKPAPLEQLNTKSLAILELYAQYRLAHLSEARETGQCTCEMWLGSTQKNNFYPMPGDLHDLKHSVRGNKTDLCCQQVNYNYVAETERLSVSIDSSKRSAKTLAELMAKKIKAAVDYQTKPTDETRTETVKVTSTVQVTCQSNVVDNATIGYGGIIRRIYYG